MVKGRLYKSMKSEEEQEQYFAGVLECFEEAVTRSGDNIHYFSIAGFNICIRFAGSHMVNIMTPALNHLRTEAMDHPDLTLCVWDSETTGVEMMPHPVGIEDFTDRGDIWGFYSKRFKTAFHWSDFSVNVLDLENGIGIYWVETAVRFPYWVFSSPLRTLFHWWMEAKGLQLIHAAAIGNDDGAVLVTGKGGQGKSTTAIACLRHGMYYLSDDYVIVGIHPKPIVFSLYNTAKITAEDLVQFPELTEICINPEKLSHEKAVMYLYPHFSENIRSNLPLRTIMLPVIHSGNDSELSSVDFWTLQRAMGFSTMSQLPNVGTHTHNFLTALISQLPCVTLNAGKIVSNIPPLIEDFLSEQGKYKEYDTTKRDTSITGMPLISVVIPVFNGEKFIRDAIENILSQNYPAIEIIIINDGSTDDTDGVVKRAEKELGVDIRYFWYGNDGPAFARNRGIRDASGEYIAFLDADDLYPFGNLKFLVSYMMKNPSVDVVRGYAQILQWDEDNGTFIPYGKPEESYPAYIGAALYRKEVFKKVGLFDASLQYAEDSDWYMRATELKINMQWLDRITLHVRRHGDNMTEGRDLVELNTLVVFKKALDRMRRGECDY
ncbi:MAG: glycosyltransferase [Bacteroidales bacterium]|nr:glycosyltransferase [Bacteroidales bacterium]